MSDDAIEREVELQASRDARNGRFILICSLIGLFGPLLLIFSRSPAMMLLVLPISIIDLVFLPLIVAGLFAANALLDPARKNILESKIRRRESQSR